jgi:hypothetical protein
MALEHLLDCTQPDFTSLEFISNNACFRGKDQSPDRLQEITWDIPVHFSH